jgi:type I restriction enzyme S subunit
LPSPLEQRRIVELVGAVDAQIDALTDEIATLNSLWRAGVADLDACDASVELGDAVDRIEAGKSPAGFDREPEPGERAVLKISAVGRGYFDPTSVKTVAANVDLPPASQVRKGDVLLVRCNGVLERVGDVCQVRDDPGPLFLCDKTLRLVPRTDIVSAEYLAHAMTSPRVKDQIAERTTGSDMRNIGQRALRELRIPVLPTNLQAVVGAALTAYLVESTALSNELADLRAFRAAFLAALLNQDVEIPESYDDLLAEVS